MPSFHPVSSSYLTTEEFLLNQTLDHYSPYDYRTFQQRYYQYLDHFRIPDGPIFLRICGEVSCNGISNDYTGVLAKKFGAAVVTLEHRYYGKRSPFETYSTENLRYLSSKQALFDLAALRQHYQASCVMGSKIVFRNGSQDPWRHATKQTSSPDMPSYLITCHNCGHCSDLSGCPQFPLSLEGNAHNCSSPDAVTKVRQKIVEHIDLWLSECQDSGRNYL